MIGSFKDINILGSFDLDAAILHDVESAKRAKKKSFERFLELGFPERGHDSYQYERLDSLYDTRYNPAKSIPQVAISPRFTNYVVLVNGEFRPELSALDKDVIFLPLSQAYKSYSALLSNNAGRLLKSNVNPFSLLNAAMHQEGLFVYVPPKKSVQFEIISVLNGKGCYVMPRISLFVGASSEVSIVQTKHITAFDGFYNGVIEACLEDNAKLTFDQADLDQSARGWAFEHFDCVLKRSSRVAATFVNLGSWLRRDLSAQLVGEGAEAEFNGVWLIDAQKEMHTNVQIEHVAPHCRSLQLFKGVLGNKARSSFQGKIYVHKEAQKTEAYQLNNNLLVSPEAEGYAKPNLEIFADDVKASHGATVGQLDMDELFYLKSRGMDESHAKKCLIWGFCTEVVAKLTSDALQREIENEVKKVSL